MWMRIVCLSIVLFFHTIDLVDAFELPLGQQSFEDTFSGGLDRWQLVNGDWAWWQVADGVLRATLTQARKLGTLVPTDEFWQGMQEYRVDFRFQALNATDKNFVVGMRDAASFYDIHFYNNKLIIEDIRAGTSIKTISIPFVLVLNHNYAVRLEYTRLGIKLWMDDVLAFETDGDWHPPLFGGKFGVKISTGSLAYSAAIFDDVIIQELDTGRIVFKQDDDLWTNDEYDHAHEWSEHPTMERFGCAVTSVAMLLRHHGFFVLPDGSILQPGSLNDWLQNQADGYVADGLVNWLAISRLSQLLSDQSQGVLPKLEFSFLQGTDEANRRTMLKEELTHGSQIGTDGDHFFLFDAYDEHTADFSLRDPLFADTLLSQKSKPLESLRVFRPSQTDLSYLLIVAPRSAQLVLADALGRSIDQAHSVEETIRSKDMPEIATEVIGADWQLFYYRQPTDGVYTFLLSAVDFQALDLDAVQLLLYRRSGAVRVERMSDLIGTEAVDLSQVKQIIVHITYDKEQESAFSSQFVYKTETDRIQDQLSAAITKANADFLSGELSFYLFYQLNHLLQYLRTTPANIFLLDRFRAFYQL